MTEYARSKYTRAEMEARTAKRWALVIVRIKRLSSFTSASIKTKQHNAPHSRQSIRWCMPYLVSIMADM